jgi:hypothetical protein
MIFYYTAGFLDSQLSISYIDFQKFHFASQQEGDYIIVYLRPIYSRRA